MGPPERGGKRPAGPGPRGLLRRAHPPLLPLLLFALALLAGGVVFLSLDDILELTPNPPRRDESAVSSEEGPARDAGEGGRSAPPSAGALESSDEAPRSPSDSESAHRPGTGGVASPPRAAAASEAPPARRTAPPPAPADPGPEPAAAPEPAAPERASPSRPREPREEPAEEPPDDPLRHDLSGWVLDPVGEPVPGLRVTATARRLTPGDRDGGATATREHQTETNPRGHFAFRQIPAGEYDLRTVATERYEAAAERVQAGTTSAVLVVREKSPRLATVSGQVESRDGGALEGVRVVPSGQPRRAASTDARGEYQLRLAADPGGRDTTLRFLLDGYREERLKLPAADLQAAGELRLDTYLEPLELLVPVTGTLTGSDGLAVGGARVQLSSPGLGRRHDAVSDGAGRFAFPRVETGPDYRLWVRPLHRYRDYLEEDLLIRAPGAHLDLVLQPLGFASLSGQMVDPEGRPVPGVSLWLRTAHAAAAAPDLVRGDREGRFFVPRLPEGRLSLQSHASPYFSFSGIELAAGRSEEVRLVLDTGDALLDGFVLTPGDEPVAGARVVLLWSRSEGGTDSRARRETVTDANGYFLFTGLGTGRHVLTAGAAGWRDTRLEPVVRAAGTEVVVRLRELRRGRE